MIAIVRRVVIPAAVKTSKVEILEQIVASTNAWHTVKISSKIMFLGGFFAKRLKHRIEHPKQIKIASNTTAVQNMMVDRMILLSAGIPLAITINADVKNY